jgi:hypothetical protein
MSGLGWSYPAGCAGVPDDDETFCQVCFGSVDDCICPECPICGVHGDPACYVGENAGHWLTLSAEQKAQKSRLLEESFLQSLREKELEEFYKEEKNWKI